MSQFRQSQHLSGGIPALAAARTMAAVVLLLVTPAVVAADALRADGDGVVPVNDTALDLGSVCSGDTVTEAILLAVAATGHGGSGMTVYANGATVTITVSATAGSGLSAVDPAAPIILPLTWTLLPNGTISQAVSSDVTLVAGPVGSFAGSVTYSAVGARSTGGTLTRTGNLTVNATVVDCDPPVLTLPADMTVEATGAAGATVTYTASAVDAVDGPITPSCAPGSGSVFALGTTVVSCSATDAAGNTATGTFSVTVVASAEPPAPPPSPSPTPTPAVPTPTPASQPVGGSLPDTAALPVVGSDLLPITELVAALGAVAAGLWLTRRAR
jgi:hypothetical protein